MKYRTTNWLWVLMALTLNGCAHSAIYRALSAEPEPTPEQRAYQQQQLQSVSNSMSNFNRALQPQQAAPTYQPPKPVTCYWRQSGSSVVQQCY